MADILLVVTSAKLVSLFLHSPLNAS